ncbi:hydroxymethylpyrimidine/phosphomethylpyrimidine kinase [Flavobacterium columnare]|uniref:hydroxymethylpyrimidine kinase n=2 Tax=Flavobacterium columnare TaxID=996 RepID=G8X9N7_FLACA|nr:hydroxymethylpyrimidine/phosphomethylpyrimidine kinase [Flavobacterium columnare]AEW86600.1 phosphomethylpyrimidine kinase [Flavobacterium columnare ATCC 49512]GEM56920.1 hydroxymethylpyrimidine/phosphomethylpyrimidine kinase [Flavobacterium columnare NBRC 100251 = ATCC 23463]
MEKMSKHRPFVLSLAGFDPSAGAGVLADVKTFEMQKVYGLAVITGNTIQTEDRFLKMEWMNTSWVIDSLNHLAKQYEVQAVKIGIIPSLETLDTYLKTIKLLWPKAKIVWDPVLKATANYEFTPLIYDCLPSILEQVDLITPNHNELDILVPQSISPLEKTELLAQHTAVLWKGGHNISQLGTDYLIISHETHTLKPSTNKIYPKHGSGCILSSAITAHLALDKSLPESCKKAKQFIEQTLNSNKKLLAYYVT